MNANILHYCANCGRITAHFIDYNTDTEPVIRCYECNRDVNQPKWEAE